MSSNVQIAVVATEALSQTPCSSACKRIAVDLNRRLMP